MSALHPISPAKLAANQANAKLSTGPKTGEGKARSASNSLKHGFSAREIVVKPEKRELFDQFFANYLTDLNPQGALETDLFNMIVHAAWNLRRIRTLEAEISQDDVDFLLDEQNEAKLDRLSRYYKRFESTLLRCTRELRTLQTNRAARLLTPECTKSAPLADPNLVARTIRSHHQAETDFVRAEIAKLDFEIATMTGKTPPVLSTDGIPRLYVAADAQ